MQIHIEKTTGRISPNQIDFRCLFCGDTDCCRDQHCFPALQAAHEIHKKKYEKEFVNRHKQCLDDYLKLSASEKCAECGMRLRDGGYYCLKCAARSARIPQPDAFYAQSMM